jgi:hypothetical protein
MGRFSLAGALWFVAFVALGFAAVRNASDLWVGATFLATLGLLCASVLGAVLERSRGGVWWLGFALFGWAYFIAGQIPALREVANLPSDRAAQAIYLYARPGPLAPRQPTLNSTAPARIGPDGRPILTHPTGDQVWLTLFLSHDPRHLTNSAQIGHWLLVLIFARAGATVSCVFTKGLPWRKKPASTPAPLPPPTP